MFHCATLLLAAMCTSSMCWFYNATISMTLLMGRLQAFASVEPSSCHFWSSSHSFCRSGSTPRISPADPDLIVAASQLIGCIIASCPEDRAVKCLSIGSQLRSECGRLHISADTMLTSVTGLERTCKFQSSNRSISLAEEEAKHCGRERQCNNIVISLIRGHVIVTGSHAG